MQLPAVCSKGGVEVEAGALHLQLWVVAVDVPLGGILSYLPENVYGDQVQLTLLDRVAFIYSLCKFGQREKTSEPVGPVRFYPCFKM